MGNTIMTDFGEQPEPNADDSLSDSDIYRLRKAMLNVISKIPKYKEWIFAIEFERDAFHKRQYVYMYVYLNDGVDINQIDVLDIEDSIIVDNKTFNKMLCFCEVLGSMGYIEAGLTGHITMKSLIREDKLNSLLNDK